MTRRTVSVPHSPVRLPDAVEAASFWASVLLPLAYVPLLYAGPDHLWTVLGLVALHAVALVLGHGHHP
jgi:hypothetical protein